FGNYPPPRRSVPLTDRDLHPGPLGTPLGPASLLVQTHCGRLCRNVASRWNPPAFGSKPRGGLVEVGPPKAGGDFPSHTSIKAWRRREDGIARLACLDSQVERRSGVED